ncbi:MAG: hypothetical protein V2J24_00385 [Pseudomonadales bacterium]|jgi:TPR repeat protein|nr:hypothetical protein [Pseudomonadales bacterium]
MSEGRPPRTPLGAGLLFLALLAGAAQAAVRPGVDPAALFARAVAIGSAGDHSLARSHLEPVLLSPRVSRGARARAYYLRGLLFYREGAFVSAGQDYRRALEFQPTLAQARAALAWLHLKGLGVDRDPARAEALYRLAARQGHLDAQYNLGLLLAKGEAVPRREREAISWFERAAEGDHAEAAALAGRLLARRARATADATPSRTLADESDLDRARHWLARAADLDHDGARVELGRLLLETDPAAGLALLEGAAERGSVSAQRQLGQLLQRGAEGVDADPARGALWLREAAKQGDASAQSWLGWAYDTGVGVDQDPARALRWYTRAARRDDATAQVNLALLYQHGRGTARREDLARRWFERAADQGHVNALSSLAWMLATAPDANDRDAARALDLARAAVAEQEDARTLEALAAALAESGRFEEAVMEQRRALALLEDASEQEADAAVRTALEARLAAYRARQAWRDP